MEVLILLLEDFRYVFAVSGVQSVSMSGVILMLLWLVDNLDFIMPIVSYKIYNERS